MDLARWDPFREFRTLKEELDRFFEDYLGRREAGELVWVPAVNLEETDDKFVLHVELPGLNKEDIKVSVTENTVSVYGERKWEKAEESATLHRAEFFTGRFRRTITLPAEIDTSKVRASYKDGVLTVELPKSERSKPREIEIEVK